ncbi:unnamed protein product [Arabidopsis arenosa]|uniref:Protein kinase domain-containing protein n=1 Tax=Arabidopsis arenosa TaxID=38785 RepID=A0A8S1ZKP1_ARAAE|nr:unnamed protein product [Arabidopsis arenosa]
METVSVLLFFFLSLLVAEARTTYGRGCEDFTCGEFDFKFPFFSTTMPSRCGLFKLNCSANVSEIQLVEDGRWYKVKSVSQANTITITDPRLNQSLTTGSCSDLSSFSIPDSPWLNLTTLYKCNNSSRKNGFSYANCRGQGSSLYYNLTAGHDDSGCSPIKTPESWVPPRNGNEQVPLRWGTKEQNDYHQEMRLGLAIGGPVILIIILVALFAIIHRNYRRKDGSELSRDNSKSDVEFSHVFFKIPIFSYKELQAATDNFSKDRLLGDGGFGTVYYGKVRDGREVAGTPGYVDPEYHRCYHLTDKSDVYSFGVVLVELISSKPAVDISRCKSEINLSSLAINKIQNHATHELIDQNLGYATNEGVRKMTTMVAELAFQCLQQDSTMRPTMEQVVQELKGIQNEEQKCHTNDHREETITLHPSPPDWGEAALLKNMKFPRSPISVTDQWTSKSTTPNTSAYEF